MRTLTVWLALALVAAGLATTGCGGGPTSISVTVSPVAFAPGPVPTIGPGQIATFKISVTDTGAAGSAGLTITAELPADFRFKDTDSVGGTAVRTSPVDPQGNSPAPTWGVWELSGHNDDVTIQFDALAGGTPGSYNMMASASGSSTSGTTQSAPLPLKLTPAAQLSASVSVSPSQTVPGQDVTYQVSVFNTGTGPAAGVGVEVTLPPVFIYDGSERILGDSGRSGGTDPVEGSELPYFDGFEIPPRQGANPGELIIKFNAQVLFGAGAEGTYPVGVQVLGDAGIEHVDIADSAPVTVS